nr:hypothetical protein [Tanacetum cinerariifolium]
MSSISNTSQISSVIAIAPVLPTKEPDNSLSMGDEHLSTIPKRESNKVIKSSFENLVPIPSEFEVTSDNESECGVPVCDDFMTFSNPLFDSDDDFSSGNDESLSNEDVSKENFKIYSSPLFDDEEIISRIEEADFDLEEEIRLVENLLYDNSSLRPPGKLNAEIANTIVESLSSSPIPVEDSDSQIEEIDLFLDTDDLMPPGIKSDDYDSEGDIYFLEELLNNGPLSLPENESSNFDHHDDPSFPHPPPEPSNVEILFDLEPDTGVLTAKVVEDIYALMVKVLPSQPTLCPILDPLLPFSSENDDKVFKPGLPRI